MLFLFGKSNLIHNQIILDHCSQNPRRYENIKKWFFDLNLNTNAFFVNFEYIRSVIGAGPNAVSSRRTFFHRIFDGSRNFPEFLPTFIISGISDCVGNFPEILPAFVFSQIFHRRSKDGIKYKNIWNLEELLFFVVYTVITIRFKIIT